MGTRRKLIVASGLVVAFVLFLATTATAQVYVGVTPPGAGPVLVSGESGVRSPSVQVGAAQGETTPRAPGGLFAFTGADIVGVCVAAGLAFALGVGLVRAGRESP